MSASLQRRTPFQWIKQIPCVLVFSLGSTNVVLADGAPLDRQVHLLDWNGDIVILLNLVLVTWLYLRGFLILHEKARQKAAASVLQPLCFFSGLAVTAICLISPLDALGEQLAAAHMVQHMLLMTVAAPLIVWGDPWRVFRHSLSPATIRGLSHLHQRVLSGIRLQLSLPSAMFAWLLYALVTWAWHFPVLYQAALSYRWVHDLQHLCFFATSIFFWRLLLVSGCPLNGNPGLGVLYLFSTTLHTTVLGVLMTLSPVSWYPHYEITAPLWNTTALEDQQLAGLIMWMPACVPYALVAVWIMWQYFENEESHQRIPAKGGLL